MDVRSFRPTCACGALASWSNQLADHNTMLELKIPFGATMSLLQLLRRTEDGEDVQYKAETPDEACPACTKGPCCTKSTHLMGVGEVLLIGLNRWSLQPVPRRARKGHGKGKGKVHVAQQYVKSGIIKPEKRIMLGGEAYHWRAALVHRGRSPESGHYLTYVIPSDRRHRVVYNDDRVSTLTRLPREVLTDARVLVYEKE